MSSRSVLAAARHRVLGVVFLVLLLFGVWVTYAIFTKKFVDYVPVTVETSNIGLQLPRLADVKIRGVLVGEVRTISSVGETARLDLAIQPDKAGIIPANATARILPKTLFGEKYVALQVPDAPAEDSISAGDVITETEVAIEVEQVLSDFYPLLRAVQPAEINYTLTAVATALEGRGKEIGANLTVLDDYLKQVNPQIPALVEDLRLLSEVSDTYRQVLPEVARFLRNSVTTGNTFVAKEQKIQALFNDVADFSATSRDFLQQHGDNIIRLGELGQAQLPTFAEYAPEYPCLLQGQANWIPQMNSGWRGHTLHINLEVLPNQPRGYTPADDPRYDADNGPHCETLPTPPYSQANPGPQPQEGEVADGVEQDLGKRRAAPFLDLTSGLAGTAAERSVVNAIASPVMGVPTDAVPDVATLLFGPLARGTEVTLR
ncbi:MAG TPA: MCE family protein [Nocardioidaceae bacterium]|nr:MCE family protein [Nocardioidaceae bacterium]